MRGPSKFKKTDVTRAAKAVLAAGLEIACVEVGKDGAIIVVRGKPDEPDVSPLDQWRSHRDSR
jgi:hypothetical protein